MFDGQNFKRLCTDQAALQDLVRLAEWEDKWGMEFHPQKCSILSVTRSRSPIGYPYQLKGHTLELQDTSKYLAVDLVNTVLEKPCWSCLEESKQYARLLAMQPQVHQYWNQDKCLLSMVRPNLEYCSSVWNPPQKDLIHKVEMIQRRAARYISNCYRNTSSVGGGGAEWMMCYVQEWQPEVSYFWSYLHFLGAHLLKVSYCDRSVWLMPRQ